MSLNRSMVWRRRSCGAKGPVTTAPQYRGRSTLRELHARRHDCFPMSLNTDGEFYNDHVYGRNGPPNDLRPEIK